MRVKDVMTSGVIGVQETASLAQAVEAMLRARINALCVFDERMALVGILSEGDLLRRGELGTEKREARWLESLLTSGRLAQDYAREHGRKVSEVMTRAVIAVDEEAPLEDAVDTMIKRGVKGLPVVKGGSVVGLITRADVLKRLYAALPRKREPRTDAEIGAAVQAEIESKGWAARAAVRVTAKDGEVTLHGTIADERLRAGLKVIAENTKGVTAVHDHLAWIEPYTGFLLSAGDDAPK
jgi:CBS-domain-containing membrane protein